MLERYTLPTMQALWLDERLKFEYWLKVELAILQAQSELGLIPKVAYLAIRRTASFDLARIHELDVEINHDMIAFIKSVQEKIEVAGAGEFKGEFHKIATSYDVEDPAQILMLRLAAEHIRDALKELKLALLQRAEEHRCTMMIARTHGQFAQPDTFGHLLLVFRSAISRALVRFQQLLENDLAEGKISGAVGNYAEVPPAVERRALQILGLRPAIAETQILQRDRHAMLVCVIATTGGTIEQMARTFWEMARSDVHELEEPRKAKQRGSSAMSHKKNPIFLEQAEGLPRLLRGLAMAALENIETPECRAIEQSSVERHILPDATSLLYYLVVRMTKCVQGLVVFPDEMLETLNVRTRGVWASQKVRNALITAGIDSDTAYEYTQQASFKAVESRRHLKEILSELPLSSTDGRTANEVLGNENLDALFNPRPYVEEGINELFQRSAM